MLNRFFIIFFALVSFYIGPAFSSPVTEYLASHPKCQDMETRGWEEYTHSGFPLGLGSSEIAIWKDGCIVGVSDNEKVNQTWAINVCSEEFYGLRATRYKYTDIIARLQKHGREGSLITLNPAQDNFIPWFTQPTDRLMDGIFAVTNLTVYEIDDDLKSWKKEQVPNAAFRLNCIRSLLFKYYKEEAFD